MAGLGHPRPQRKTFNHPRRSHGRNGSKSSFTVYAEESPQKHSVMYIVQNLFHRGKHHRTTSLNAHYMVLLKNPRYVSQIIALAHQMYPQRTTYFLEAYTALPHGYLVIDMKQETPDILRLRSHIFSGEKQIAYAGIYLYIRVYPRLIQFYERFRRSNMVSQRLKKHASDIVYLQKARPCICNHVIAKADRSLVDCVWVCRYHFKRQRPVS